MDSEEKNVRIRCHPDTGEEIKGYIPHWDVVVQAGKDFGAYFPQLKYLGFDIVVTDEGEAKVIGINSLSSLDCFEQYESVFDTPAGEFFRRLQKEKKKNIRV